MRTTRSFGVLLLASMAGCASRAATPGPFAKITCPRGAVTVDDRDSDVGWAGTEHLVACARDGELEGWAREDLAGTSTVLVGRYVHGRRVGTWTQYDVDDRAGRASAASAGHATRALGTFTLDADGSGVERVEDREGHVLQGAVVRGRRDGVWTFADRDHAVVATETWSNGRYVTRHGRAPWDPPMIDTDDLCHDAGEDGC